MRLLLLDGPCARRSVVYGHPLPPVLVVADKSFGIRYHDYVQHGPDTYRHAQSCRCHFVTRAVDLDASG